MSPEVGALSVIESIIVIIAIIAISLMLYAILYRILKKEYERLSGLSEEEKSKVLGIVKKGSYYLPEKLPWYKNPRFWEIFTLIVSIILLILMW
ncbi:MAG: hypothetical protein QXE38_05395 [Candidatus Methanomethylicia archaeon]